MEPIRHVVTVASSAADAFTVFTAGMTGWWDPTYSPDPASYRGIAFDPRVGGLVAVLEGDEGTPFGAVTVWEPGVRYAQTFWLGGDPAYPSALDVRFEDVDGVCEVTFEHGGWHAGNVDDRKRYGEWPHLLGRFATACAAPD